MKILKVKQEDGSIVSIPIGQGSDGHTPVKGVDYFTEQDKDELVTAVIAALPIYDGSVTSV
jgi:hypothetical protein